MNAVPVFLLVGVAFWSQPAMGDRLASFEIICLIGLLFAICCGPAQFALPNHMLDRYVCCYLSWPSSFCILQGIIRKFKEKKRLNIREEES